MEDEIERAQSKVDPLVRKLFERIIDTSNFDSSVTIRLDWEKEELVALVDEAGVQSLYSVSDDGESVQYIHLSEVVTGMLKASRKPKRVNRTVGTDRY